MPVLVARRAATRTAASDAVVVASPATVVVADVAVRPKEAAVGDTPDDVESAPEIIVVEKSALASA